MTTKGEVATISAQAVEKGVNTIQFAHFPYNMYICRNLGL